MTFCKYIDIFPLLKRIKNIGLGPLVAFIINGMSCMCVAVCVISEIPVVTIHVGIRCKCQIWMKLHACQFSYNVIATIVLMRYGW